MTTNQSVVNFLCDPTNLGFAVDVADAFDDVFNSIERRFVDRLYAAFRPKFDRWPKAGDWELGRHYGDEKSNGSRYAGLWLIPRSRAGN